MTITSSSQREAEELAADGRPDSLPALSYMVADIGSCNTAVTLFDVVDGAYRLVATGSALTSTEQPWLDVIKGVQQAINQVTRATGRTILNERGGLIQPSRADGSGVDYFGVLVSAAEPLQVLVVGLLEEFSLASARRALGTIYGIELDCFSISDERSKREQAEAVFDRQPELVLVCGGTDGTTNSQLAELVGTLSVGIGMLDENLRPQVVYAGNDGIRARVQAGLDLLTDVHFVENIRPRLDEERLDPIIGRLGDLYLTEKAGALPGFSEMINWSNQPPINTAHAFGGIGEYFAALHKGQVLCLDIGSNSVTFVSATPEKVELVVRSDLGMGKPIIHLMDHVTIADIGRWIIADKSGSDILDFLHNKALQPQVMAIADDELDIEQALIHQMITTVVEDASRVWDRPFPSQVSSIKRLVLRGGVLTGARRPGTTLLTMLNALQPRGLFPVSLDRHGILPALGLLAPVEPRLVVQLLDSDALENLGWVIVPVGPVKVGELALKIQVDSATLNSLQFEITAGSLEVIPLASGERAELSLEPAQSVDVGYGPGKGIKIRVNGGTVGLVVDARGRPLLLSDDESARRKQLQQWLWDVGG